MVELDQDTQGLAYRFRAYCKQELTNFYYLLSFQPDRVVLDGDDVK